MTMCKRWARAALSLGVALANAALAATTAVPPAQYAPPPAAKPAPLARLVAADAPKRIVSLAAPSEQEWSALRERNRALGERSTGAVQARARAIGIGRDVPVQQRTIEASQLAWVAVGDGRHAARIDVRSPGAAGVRVAIAMDEGEPDVALRFVGAASGAEVFAVPANAVAGATLADGVYWSPVLEGDTATIEIVAAAGIDRDRISIALLRIAHLARAGASLREPMQKDVTDIGTSGGCNVDVACVVPSPALSVAARSTAEIVFNDAQFVYECSGTLLNDSIATNTPYFYTASHCIESQALATTINFYWFFDAVACNDRGVPPYVLQTGGAMLLGRSDDADWALLRANRAPPAGVAFSGWRAEPLPFAAASVSLHHPNGDLKKFSQGTFQGYYDRPGRNASFATILWRQGTTEPGSSGGGLFTLGPSGYELRGGLWAGSASCSNPGGTDQFSRLDLALPLLRQYLTPDDASPNGTVAVVEFYHQGLDHYFMTASPLEINDLDTGVHTGWVRTGFRFLAYPDASRAPGEANPVCRFYLPPDALGPGVGDSHFYSGSPFECAQTAARFPAWFYEAPNVFYVQLPNTATGACPANTRPVWRFFHASRTNHRYTTEVAVRDALRSDPAWTPEGDGPDDVVMCTPTA